MTAPRLDLLWPRLDALIDRAGDADLRSHRLEVLGARRRRANGRPVPASFVEQERAAAVAAITAPLVLERVAAAYEKPAVLVKGPEVAALYPAPALRNYWDLDLLVGDAEEAQNALLAAGFEAVGDPDLYVDIHHLRPLRPPGLVLAVELHTTPKWLDGRMAPAVSELLAASIPRDEGPGGIRRLPPEQHALLLAAHSWAHEPLRRLRDLLDIALVAAAADPAETARLARSWGIERLWRTTRSVLAGLEDGRTTPPLHCFWARNLVTARERTVLESHGERLTSDFSALPVAAAVRRLPRNLLRDLRPEDAEPWREKFERTALALRNARRPRSQHDSELDGRKGSPDRKA